MTRWKTATPSFLFPEGTRGNAEEPQSFKAGLYNLAQKFPGVVLVPAWINNVQRVMPKGEVVPVPVLCSVTFGAPMQIGRRRRTPRIFRPRPLGRYCIERRVINRFILGLTPGQQVGLLFVLVFGLLLIGSCREPLRCSIREPMPTTHTGHGAPRRFA